MEHLSQTAMLEETTPWKKMENRRVRTQLILVIEADTLHVERGGGGRRGWVPVNQ